MSASSITYTGSNFPLSGYNAKAKFSGVEADSVIVSSETTAVATWNLGVPKLRFESQTNLGSALMANPNTVTLTNPLTISSSNAA